MGTRKKIGANSTVYVLPRAPAQSSAIGHRDLRFIMTGIGTTPTPEVAERVRVHQARVAEAMRPFATGATYAEVLDLEGASLQRVRVAYSPEVFWKRLVALKGRYDPKTSSASAATYHRPRRRRPQRSRRPGSARTE